MTPSSRTSRYQEVLCPLVGAWDGVSLDALRSPWTGAARLLLSENSTGRPPLWGTEVRVGWHAGELLALFLCQDPEPWATLTERDGSLWEEEVVEVFLDPFGDGDCYFEFEVNPLNTVLDLFVRRVRSGLRKDPGWHCDGLRTAAGRLTYGWVAGLAIPFQSLGNWEPTAAGWRVNFCRIERPKNRPRELSAWSPTFANTFHVPARFGFAELARASSA